MLDNLLIGEATQLQLLEIYGKMLRENRDLISEADYAEMEFLLEDRKGFSLGVAVETVKMKLEGNTPAAVPALIWTYSEDRSKMYGAALYKNNGFQYTIDSFNGYSKVICGGHVVKQYSTSTAAKDYAEGRYRYLVRSL